MNRALLWKDFLLLKDTIFAGLALLSISYVIAGMLVYMDSDGFSWSKAIAGGASLARFTTVLICALVGGHVYGREREDHSASFLNQLPVARRDVARSKTIVSTAVLALFWVVSMTVLALGLVAAGYQLETVSRVLFAMIGFFASAVVVFGSAMLASLFVSSSVGASFAGLLVLVPIIAVQSGLNSKFANDSRLFFHWAMIILMLLAGIGSALLSSWLHIHAFDNATKAMDRVFGLSRLVRRAPAETVELEFWRKQSAIGALLWKDYRLIRTSLQLGLIAILFPYAIGVMGIGLLENAPTYFRGASLICAAIGIVVVSFWAGQITSTEHITKTNNFSSYLPIPRRLSLASKLLLTLCPSVAIAATNAACLLLANNSIPGQPQFGAHYTWNDWNQNGFIAMGLALANATILSYSFAWLLGTHYRRPALAIISGIVVAPLCVMVWASFSAAVSMAEYDISPLYFVSFFSAGATLTGLASVAIGAALDYRSFSK